MLAWKAGNLQIADFFSVRCASDLHPSSGLTHRRYGRKKRAGGRLYVWRANQVGQRQGGSGAGSCRGSLLIQLQNCLDSFIAADTIGIYSVSRGRGGGGSRYLSL